MGRYEDGIMHIGLARKCKQNNDFFGARMGYLKAVESFKQANAIKELGEANNEYENFIIKDPVFIGLLSVLIEGIKVNPGILQSEITNKAEESNWSDVYKYNRPILKDDIYYVLYFAEKFGIIKKLKKGNTYELYVIDKENSITSEEYYKLTEDAGNYFRSKEYEKSIDCCIKIVNNIESIKLQIPDFINLNKDFIFYSFSLLFVYGLNENTKALVNKIISSNIITKKKLLEEIEQCFEFDGYKDIEKAKIIANYLNKLDIYSEKQTTSIIKKIEKDIRDRINYEKNMNKEKTLILNFIKQKKNVTQKEIFSLLPNEDEGFIVEYIKELENEELINRIKEKGKYIISLK